MQYRWRAKDRMVVLCGISSFGCHFSEFLNVERRGHQRPSLHTRELSSPSDGCQGNRLKGTGVLSCPVKVARSVASHLFSDISVRLEEGQKGTVSGPAYCGNEQKGECGQMGSTLW